MTRVVRESSPEHKRSEQRAMIEALARRPAPAAAGGTRPWIVLDNAGQTLGNNVAKKSRFDSAWWDPVLVTNDPAANTNSIFRIDVAVEDSFNLWELTTKIEGWYTFELVHTIGQFSPPPASLGYFLNFINFGSSGMTFAQDINIREAKDWPTSGVGELEAAPRLNLYRTVHLPANKLWPVTVQQTSGADRDCSGHLKVWYDDHFGSTTTDNANWTVDAA